MASRWSSSIFGISIALFVSACGGSGGESPTTPSASGGSLISSAQATSTAENVGTLTLTAIQNGATQAGVRAAPPSSRLANAPLAALGSIFGTATCPGGGRLELTQIREYTPSGGEVDLSALKAVYTACLFTSSGSSFQIAGELALSGRYYGASRTPEINVSGSLTTSNGTCAISGGVNGTGGFSGTACGTSATTNPPAPAPPAPTLTGTWTGQWTTYDANENCGRDENSLQLVLTQTGNNVNGTITWTITQSFYPPDVGKTNSQPITGSVSGTSVTFTLGPYTASGTFTSTGITGSFGGLGCQAMPFTVTRQ